MSFIDCVKGKNLTRGQVERLQERYDYLVGEHMRRGGAADAAVKAAADIVELESSFIRQRNLNAERSAAALNGVRNDIDSRTATKVSEWETITSNSKVSKAFEKSGLAYKPTKAREFQELLMRIDNTAEAHSDMVFGQMPSAVSVYNYSIDLLGRQTREGKEAVDLMIRAAGGEEISDIAINYKGKNISIKQAGKEMREALDKLRDEFISTGGVMGRLENWMPQIHDPVALRSSGYEVWRDSVKDSLDWARIKDSVGYAIPEESREKFLKEVFETLSTDGMNKIAAQAAEGKSRFGGKGSLVGRRQAHRVLHFLSPKHQLDYNAKFGADDMFSAVQHHIEGMSRDIQIIKHLGPNPNAVVDNLNGHIGKENMKFANAMYRVMLGNTSMTGNEHSLYKAFKGVTGMLRAAQLGSAVIPALGDSVFVGYTAKMAGLDITNAVGNYMKGSYVKGAPVAQAELDMYAAQAATGGMLKRIIDDGSFAAKGRHWSDKLMRFGQGASSAVMRASFLSDLTEHAKTAITTEAWGRAAMMRGKSWGELGPDFQEMMSKLGGIDEADWGIIQKAIPEKVEGRNVELLTTENIVAVDDPRSMDVAMKYKAYITGLRRMATNEPDLRTKTFTTAGMEAGSAWRPVIDSAMMYRAFPVTMTNNFIRAMVTRGITRGGMTASAELGSMIILTTMMGYLVLGAKDFIRGKSSPEGPLGFRELNPDTLQQAMLQGGGLSIFGDFVVQDQSRFGQSMTETLMGAPFGFMSDTVKLLRGDLIGAGTEMALDGTDKSWERFKDNGVQYLKRYTPGASLWYLRGILGYTVGDSLEAAITGQKFYERKMREQRRLAEQGIEYIK